METGRGWSPSEEVWPGMPFGWEEVEEGGGGAADPVLISEFGVLNSEFGGEIRLGWGGGEPSSLYSTPFDSLLCPESLVL